MALTSDETEFVAAVRRLAAVPGAPASADATAARAASARAFAGLAHLAAACQLSSRP